LTLAGLRSERRRGPSGAWRAFRQRETWAAGAATRTQRRVIRSPHGAPARLLREHEITLVTKASEALERLTAKEHFDIIFSDLMMPEMSGMGFYEELSKRDPKTAERVVFVTGGAFTPAAQAFLARVGNKVVEKPIDPKAMRSLVNELVARAA
jgi:CheY-like chemotaxis protein